MHTPLDRYKSDLKRLIEDGEHLLDGLHNELSKYLKDDKKASTKNQKEPNKQYRFRSEYNAWYNESLALIRQLIPDRLDDFKQYYKYEKRKEFSYETYSISDYLMKLVLKDSSGDILLGTTEVIQKFRQQFAILKSLEKRFDSSLYEIRQLLQADLFDSEIDTAKELAAKGFYRAAGAVCGVVLEKHLAEVCANHQVQVKKKAPHISDLNDALKSADVIDVPMWRQIQQLGDLRNLCDHKKEREPDADDLTALIRGTESVIKNLF